MPNPPKRILIVDDEATLLFFLQQSLQESLVGCRVEIASTGEDAVKQLTYHPFELLITDLKMPGINGFTVAESARSLYPNIKVILMTAYGSREIREEAKNICVDAYLSKPFPTAQLQLLVHNLFTSNSRNSPNLVGNHTPQN